MRESLGTAAAIALTIGGAFYATYCVMKFLSLSAMILDSVRQTNRSDYERLIAKYRLGKAAHVNRMYRPIRDEKLSGTDPELGKLQTDAVAVMRRALTIPVWIALVAVIRSMF